MKKTVLVMIVLSLALGIPGIAKSNAAEVVVWQIGFPHGDINPIDGSAEYPANGMIYTSPQFTYVIGSDEDPINAPEFPGYIALVNVCDIAPGRPCTDTAAQIDINFTLDCDYAENDELTLVYGRYGSDTDLIFLYPEILIGSPSGNEGEYKEFSFPLGALSAGDYTINIIYEGSGAGNGHYIDYLKLVSTKRCLGPIEVDIKPGSCPNPLNVKSKGVLPVALLGTEDFDVRDVDVASLRLEGVAPIRSAFEDVATALAPLEDKEECYLDCNDLGPDEFEDLTLKFYRQEIVGVLGDVEDGECVVLQLTGNLMDGTPIEGEDVILVLDKPNAEAKQEKKGKK